MAVVGGADVSRSDMIFPWKKKSSFGGEERPPPEDDYLETSVRIAARTC
jgi:hypothetical protein